MSSTNNAHQLFKSRTDTSGGLLCTTTRTEWEDDMFDRHYAKATPFRRVKYGVLCPSASATGIEKARLNHVYCRSLLYDFIGIGLHVQVMSSTHHRHYSDSYLELKNDVRLRCTFGRKSHMSCLLGALNSYNLLPSTSTHRQRFGRQRALHRRPSRLRGLRTHHGKL